MVLRQCPKEVVLSLENNQEDVIEMILEKLFVPSNCLQGEEFSTYLLWPQDKSVKVQVEVPEALEILRIYNAERINSDGNTMFEVSEFEENGYLGIVLRARRLSEHTRDEEILFSITDSQGRSQVERRCVHLFRPSLRIVSIPSQVLVRLDRKRVKCFLKENILISNEGEGMAVIDLEASEDSELDISMPKETAEFAKNFWEDFTASLETIKHERPEHAPLIDKLISIADSPPSSFEALGEKIKETAEELDNAFLNDLEFAEDFSSSLVVAYRKNLHIIPEVESFVTYLKSMEPNRIMIRNPIGVINVDQEPKTFRGEIRIMDFGYNTFEPVAVEFRLVAEEKCDVPIHKIFSVISENQVLE